jgi:hypothetical protein
MNDLTTHTHSAENNQVAQGADPLVKEAAGAAEAAKLARAAFNAILNGEMVLVSELARATDASSDDVDGLIGRGLVIDDDGRVVAAHGLSLVPARQHRLSIRGRRFWTWCAIDAVGIPAGLGEDAEAETTCHWCGTPVRLEFKAGDVVRATHPSARVWDAHRLEGRGTAGPPHCALMNLFCSAEHLTAWHAAHPSEQGHERDLAAVGELGRAEWGASDRCGCDDDAQGNCRP